MNELAAADVVVELLHLMAERLVSGSLVLQDYPIILSRDPEDRRLQTRRGEKEFD